ncbi:hypothetical protein C8R47DRAFT_1221470 [Mycena vitilis]|nr:hypothetical protein C8R47DRAFT_1221470 [Mycena vitilis]
MLDDARSNEGGPRAELHGEGFVCVSLTRQTPKDPLTRIGSRQRAAQQTLPATNASTARCPSPRRPGMVWQQAPVMLSPTIISSRMLLSPRYVVLFVRSSRCPLFRLSSIASLPDTDGHTYGAPGQPIVLQEVRVSHGIRQLRGGATRGSKLRLVSSVNGSLITTYEHIPLPYGLRQNGPVSMIQPQCQDCAAQAHGAPFVLRDFQDVDPVSVAHDRQRFAELFPSKNLLCAVVLTGSAEQPFGGM